MNVDDLLIIGKVAERICELNHEGVSRISEDCFEESVAYFAEAEKTLEYAASCGKNIDRVLITTTLRNQACAYQRKWELDVCSDYI